MVPSRLPEFLRQLVERRNEITRYSNDYLFRIGRCEQEQWQDRS